MSYLTKAVSIMEQVFGQDGKPMTPSQAAMVTGLNLATCSRIMTELNDAGYLDKVSRRSGYVGGPQIFALAGRSGIYHEIVEASRGPLLELAANLGVTINLAVMEQARRRILLSTPPPGGKLVTLQNTYESYGDFCDTATGQLLLSRLTPEVQKTILDQVCMPSTKRKEMEAELVNLRKVKETVFHHPGMGLWIIGALLEPPELPVFAFGFGVPEVKKESGVAACSHAAELIAIKFQHHQAIAF